MLRPLNTNRITNFTMLNNFTAMKTTLLSIVAFFAFTAYAAAQEEHDKTVRQPPLVTQAQVEKDAKLAEQERKKHEKENKAVKEENKKGEDKKATNTINSSSPKKTSTQPGKQ